jgi:hypothetical protein
MCSRLIEVVSQAKRFEVGCALLIGAAATLLLHMTRGDVDDKYRYQYRGL